MNIYEEYAVLEAQMKVLSNQKDELKAKILTELVDGGVEKAETAVGKFTISNLKKWTYTPKVEEMNEAYKAQKATEESNGDATFETKPSLRYTPIKL